MTRVLSLDPGQNSGIALGYYDAITPYRLLERWQVHGGLEGFKQWWRTERPEYDELVVEQFILSPLNEFTADLTPVHIEGALSVLCDEPGEPQPVWQLRGAKGELVGYPPEANTKARRQSVRFKFLAKFGLHKPGKENDDSNDAITHALVYLKRRKHGPSHMAFWPDSVGSIKAKRLGLA